MKRRLKVAGVVVLVAAGALLGFVMTRPPAQPGQPQVALSEIKVTSEQAEAIALAALPDNLHLAEADAPHTPSLRSGYAPEGQPVYIVDVRARIRDSRLKDEFPCLYQVGVHATTGELFEQMRPRRRPARESTE